MLVSKENCYNTEYISEKGNYLIFKTKWSIMMLVTFFVSDNLDNTVPDHNFLFPEFEIVIETEDEIMPEVVERDDESQIIGSMGKESVSKLIHWVNIILERKGSICQEEKHWATHLGGFNLYFSNTASFEDSLSVLPPWHI